MKTLIEFASDQMLTQLLVRERAKYLHLNKNENCDRKKNHLSLDEQIKRDKQKELDELPKHKMLSRMMPPRRTWVRPRKRNKLPNSALNQRRNAEKAMLLTIKRDKKDLLNGKTFRYLDELQAFCDRIRKRLSDEQLQLTPPQLIPIFKDKEKLDEKTWKVTCRPLAVYTKLEDKIILALTNRYLARYLNRYLHENILSYRAARTFHGKEHYMTDFNDGARLIKTFREEHLSENIYAADCDIKTFYDVFSHEMVRDCFRCILDKTRLDEDGKGQVMRVLNAYLNSYNFYDNALKISLDQPGVFGKIQHRFHDKDGKNTYLLKRVDDVTDEEFRHRGVPQGGALSLPIANIVLNDVDKVIVDHPDDNRLFIRYCDDMILLHTDYDECERLMNLYVRSLTDHGLYYHDPKQVSESKQGATTTQQFWKIKSHSPFLWGQGEGNSNLYVGFLGYEIRRDGRMRLRKSNIDSLDQKFVRHRYALHRYRREHPEDYLTFRQNMLDKTMRGLEVYTAFDQEQFRHGAQYRHLERQRARLEGQ